MGGAGGGLLGGITLTSTALTEGGMFAAANTCAGAQDSLPLQWTAGPTGTMSYAVVLTDMTNNLVHYAIWDIPAATMSLPAALVKQAMPPSPAGAKQVSFQNATKGYYGPCPGGSTHTYRFVVYALDVATLPTVTTTSTPAQVVTQIQMHDLATGSLSGTSNAM